jgi:hypothetical protein
MLKCIVVFYFFFYHSPTKFYWSWITGSVFIVRNECPIVPLFIYIVATYFHSRFFLFLNTKKIKKQKKVKKLFKIFLFHYKEKLKTEETLFGPVNFSDCFKKYIKVNSRIWFVPVNSNFSFRRLGRHLYSGTWNMKLNDRSGASFFLLFLKSPYMKSASFE